MEKTSGLWKKKNIEATSYVNSIRGEWGESKNKLHLVDSVILIDHLTGVKEATSWLRKNGSKNSVISVIIRAEILAGAESHEKYHITALLDEFECLPIEE